MVLDFFSDYTLRTVALGSGILGIVSGALGSYAVLRKQSLLGDTISHASLPGIALAFILTGSKSPLVLLLGAVLAGWLATMLVISVIRNTRIKEDSALGVVLSIFFGFGIVLLTFIQKLPNASQAGLDKFLFGQAATLLHGDVILMASLGIPALVLVALLWKELKIFSFDPDYASTLGFPVRKIEILLTTLIVISIVIGLQTVGVVLMSAMIVAPAAAARQWTDKLSAMVILSALFGATSGIMGAILSSVISHIPTGPTIVIVLSVIVMISILFAPNRGLVWSWIRRRKSRHQLQLHAVLEDLLLLSKLHEDPFHTHDIATIRTMASGHGGVDRTLAELEERGLARRVVGWSLTKVGLEEAQQMAQDMGGKK